MNTTKTLRLLAIPGILFTVGCVQPDPNKPWSTREQSSVEVGMAVEEVEAVEEVAVSSPEPVVLLRPESTAPVEIEKTETVVVGKRIEEFGQIPEPVRIATPMPEIANRSPREAAIDLLLHAAHEDDPLLRANAFEGLQYAPKELQEVVELGLQDENRGVRFVAAMSLAKAGLMALASSLEPLLADDSESVRAAAIYGLRTLGKPVDPTPLASMAMSNDPEVRANAYLVLGLMANPSAIPMIEASLGTSMRLANPMRVKITDLQAAEALVEMGRIEEIEPIRAALFAPVEQGEITILACNMLGRLQDQQARPMLMRLITAPGNQARPLEIRLAAAAALFQLDPPHEPMLAEVILTAVDDPNPWRRVQATAGLAVMPGAEAESTLIRMLQDQNPVVRTAAAASLARRLSGSN